MSLKVMCAGCSAEDKERAESDVRKALGPRADGPETWVVSVVSVAGRWSVTLDGPGIRALACTAPPGKLTESIRDALQARTGGPPPAPAPAAPGPAPAAAAPRAPAAPAVPRTATPAAPVVPRAATPAAPASAPPRPPAASAPAATAVPRPAADGSHACEKCAQRFRVVFESMPGEPRVPAPVACPHCWHVNRVPVAESAAAEQDYRAEKA